MQAEAKLVGHGSGAGRAVRRQMRLPRLDMVFDHATVRVDVLIGHFRSATFKVGYDEASICSLRTCLDTRNNAFHAAPACRTIEEFGKPAHLARLSRGLEAFSPRFQFPDMPAQCRGRRYAKDKVNAIGATTINDEWAGVMAVGPDQNTGIGPVAADHPHKAAQVGTNFGTARPFSRTQHCGNEPALNIKDDNRLGAVFIIMGIEQTKLLATMNGITGIIDIKHDPLRHLPVRGAVKVDHCLAHGKKFANIRKVRQPAHR